MYGLDENDKVTQKIFPKARTNIVLINAGELGLLLAW